MPILRHRLATLIGGIAVFGALLVAGGGAQAQTYPPGTTVPACVVGDVNAGNVHVGDTVTFTLCGNFAAGTAVTVTVNGATVAIPPKTPVNGAVTVHIKVVSTSVLEVEDPVQVAAVCGLNSVTATGLTATASTASVKGTFNLICTATTTTASPGGLAFTGANILLAILIALALIVAGAVLVIVQRRRRQVF